MSIMPVSSMACGLQDSEVRLMVRAGVGPVSPPSFMAADVEMCRWAVAEIGALREAVHKQYAYSALSLRPGDPRTDGEVKWVTAPKPGVTLNEVAHFMREVDTSTLQPPAFMTCCACGSAEHETSLCPVNNAAMEPEDYSPEPVNPVSLGAPFDGMTYREALAAGKVPRTAPGVSAQDERARILLDAKNLWMDRALKAEAILDEGTISKLEGFVDTRVNAHFAYNCVTLRDRLAMAALTGLLGQNTILDMGCPEELAGECYQVADAMLKVRNGVEPGSGVGTGPLEAGAGPTEADRELA